MRSNSSSEVGIRDIKILFGSICEENDSKQNIEDESTKASRESKQTTDKRQSLLGSTYLKKRVEQHWNKKQSLLLPYQLKKGLATVNEVISQSLNANR
jgi:hypothetical protein